MHWIIIHRPDIFVYLPLVFPILTILQRMAILAVMSNCCQINQMASCTNNKPHSFISSCAHNLTLLNTSACSDPRREGTKAVIHWIKWTSCDVMRCISIHQHGCHLEISSRERRQLTISPSERALCGQACWLQTGTPVWGISHLLYSDSLLRVIGSL